MSDESLKRFDRIMAMLIQLQSKRIVRAQELADRFQDSLRTIYRDVRTLETSGIPIMSDAGKGYSIMPGYHLPPVMFTREEAGSFVAAEKLMQKFTDKSLGAFHQSAMFKVKSVLNSTGKDWVTALDSQLHINPGQELFRKDIENALEILFEGIAGKKQVILHYQSIEAENPTERVIEPVGLFHENNYWYLMGYCHLRKDYRQFRSDRISGIKSTETPNTLEHGSIDQYLKKESTAANTTVKLLVDKKIARYISGDKKYYGFVSEKITGHQVEMTFLTSNINNGFARWFLMFGDYAQILEPPGLKQRVKELLEKMSQKLDLKT
ncbi:YafY family protein [soil metagenome]